MYKILIPLLLLASCSTMHLKVSAPYKSPAKSGRFTYEKSYSLGTFPWICGLTFWFYGGGCWVYTMMPMVPQEEKFLKDAKAALKERLGSEEVELVDPEVLRRGWDQRETKLDVEAPQT